MRFLLADDHEVVRRGLRALLEGRPGWTVVAEAADGREAVALAAATCPDVVVLDLVMPGLNGVEATRQIRRELPGTAVLVFSMHQDEQLVREALLAGARGYLLKDDAAEQLLPAVEAVAAGQSFFSASLPTVLLNTYAWQVPLPGREKERLTGREREVVQLLAEGQGNKEVAEALGMRVKTVETHRAAIMRKLELGSLADLVRYAIRNHLIEP